jgi:hypothetical protein
MREQLQPRFVSDLPCDPRGTAVLRLLGYRQGRTPVSPETEKLLERVFQRGPTLAEPKAVWAVAPFDERSSSSEHPGRSRVLSGAAEVAVAVCTIGPRLEQEAADLSRRGELALASIMDAWGSEAVETLAQSLQRRIKRQLAEHDAGNRLSPGYRGWPVEDQAWLFRLVPADRIGVSLTPGFMMVPRKSISFVMKLRAKEERE